MLRHCLHVQSLPRRESREEQTGGESVANPNPSCLPAKLATDARTINVSIRNYQMARS